MGGVRLQAERWKRTTGLEPATFGLGSRETTPTQWASLGRCNQDVTKSSWRLVRIRAGEWVEPLLNKRIHKASEEPLDEAVRVSQLASRHASRSRELSRRVFRELEHELAAL